MYELLIGTIIEIIFLGICITFTLVFCQKKKPAEDLTAHPKITAPATAIRTSQEVRQANNNNEKPNIEHTISIKLDNNADDDDMQGPRESMSRDPMTELPPGTLKPKPVVLQEEYDPDKGAETPPSNLQWDPNKKEASSKKPAAAAINAASPMIRDASSKRKKRTVDLDATQEFKASKEENAAPSNKLLSLKSARSGNPKRKSKSKPKNNEKNTLKSHRGYSAMSIKTTPKNTPRTAQSPTCISKNRDDPTKECDVTQKEE
uniref:Uncharacterized protein n=1 Tax=Panagrolaimus sp. PS1159 TaxID=55785 RepID=A0AC35GFX6_9BILA